MAAIAGLIISVVGLGLSYLQGEEAKQLEEDRSQSSKRAEEAQQRAANVKAQQERIKQTREARIARAQVISGATTSGIGAGSSGISGATSSISSQLGANIGSINVAQTFAEQASTANQQAANAASAGAIAGIQAQQWQTISGVGQSIFKSQKPKVEGVTP